MKNHKIKITLDHSISYLPVLLHAVRIFAKLTGFSKDEITKIETAIEETVSDVIRYAYNKSESTFDVSIIAKTMGLLIIIKEDGLPFTPGMEHEYSPNTIQPKPEYRENNSFFIEKLMDKVWFHSFGKDGLETHLFKYYEKYNSQVTTIAESETPGKERIEPLPEKTVSYVVRRMKPEEAIHVSRVAYNSYGNTYLHSDIYYPYRVRELNKKDQLMSFIAITDSSEVIAHLAFERSSDKGIPELGVAFTKPKYRGIGCLNKLMSTAMEEAEKLSFTGVFAQAVSSHPYSQKTLRKFGFKDCALFLSLWHELAFKNIEQKKLQRESAIISFQYFNPPPKMTIYPPGHHAEMIAALYENIGFNPEIGRSNTAIAPDVDKSVLSVDTDLDNLTADITLTTFGKNILAEVHRILKNLCHNNTATIYLRIRLTDPFTAKYTAEFEKMGFFFSGILPRSTAKDQLILQYLNNNMIDFDQLKIDSDKGKEILEYVRKCSKTS
jgi:serine/threonine-protein kinase RsbW